MSCDALYVHIPFCESKCPYCDFYSVKADGDLMDRYIGALEHALKTQPYKIQRLDTVYFGGGTPSASDTPDGRGVPDVHGFAGRGDHGGVQPAFRAGAGAAGAARRGSQPLVLWNAERRRQAASRAWSAPYGQGLCIRRQSGPTVRI